MQKNKSIIYLSIILTCLLLIIFLLYIGRQQKINFAKNEAQKYLQVKYNKNFKLKLKSSGYKTKKTQFFNDSISCGHDKNILEYVFYVHADDLDVPFFVTVWVDKVNNSIEVEEIEGGGYSYESTSYTTYKKFEQEKKSIINELNNILSKNYKSYRIDSKSFINAITVSVKDYLYNEYNKDTINKIVELLEDKNIMIMIYYNDGIKKYNSDSKKRINNLILDIKYYHDIYIYLKENANYKYKLRFDSSDIVQISIDDYIYINYNERYEKLYNYIQNMDRNYNNTKINFKDKSIDVYYYENKTLKDIIYD